MARKPPASLVKALEAMEPQFREAFLAAVNDVKSSAQLSVIARAIEENRIDDAIRALNLRPEFFAPLDDAIRAAFLEGGRQTLELLPRIPEPSGERLVVRFGGSSPRAQRWVADHSSRLITAITEDQRAAVREAIEAGLSAGRNPRRTALDLIGRINRATGRREGGIIGLTRTQASALARAREELASGDPARLRSYLGRKLRDKRFDSVVLRAIRDEKAVAAKDIANITRNYSNKLLRLRGETVARTETLGALHAGQTEALQELVDNNQVQPQFIRRVWRTAGDSRVRDLHNDIEGESVGLNERFSNGLMFPAEPGGPPEQVINCRCTVDTRIDFLANAVPVA